jgi:hypothetical protein
MGKSIHRIANSSVNASPSSVPSANHNVHLSLTRPMSSAEGRHRSGHTGEIVKVPEFTSRAPNEGIDPSTSSIEDVSEAAKSSPPSPKKQMRRVRKLTHSRPNFEMKGQATRRVVARHGKLGHQIEQPQITSEALFKNENSSDESSIIEDTSPSPPLQIVAPSGTSVTRASAGLKRSKTEVIKKRVKDKKDKERINQMLPEDFARMLMNNTQPVPHGAARRRCAQFLAGKNIFYTGGDKRFATERTRNRMKIVSIYLFFQFSPTHIALDSALRWKFDA